MERCTFCAPADLRCGVSCGDPCLVDSPHSKQEKMQRSLLVGNLTHTNLAGVDGCSSCRPMLRAVFLIITEMVSTRWEVTIPGLGLHRVDVNYVASSPMRSLTASVDLRATSGTRHFFSTSSHGGWNTRHHMVRPGTERSKIVEGQTGCGDEGHSKASEMSWTASQDVHVVRARRRMG